jgi:hypothetical protein
MLGADGERLAWSESALESGASTIGPEMTMPLPLPLAARLALILGALWLAQTVIVMAAGVGQGLGSPTGGAPEGAPGRIDVFKPDGSRQCEPDSGTPIAAMRKQLTVAGIEVHAARTTTDGMHHAQVCGAPTGRIHVFTIDAAAAETAADLGFLPGAAIGLPPPGAVDSPPPGEGPSTP